MDNEIDYTNNPLHGLGLKSLLDELVDHYGFEMLFAYLNINCFKTNPSILSSIKFLKKTDWAREKVEVFYLYEFKNLPRASSEQFLLSPRDRVIPAHQKPGEPAELSLEDAEQLRVKRAKRSDEKRRNGDYGPSRGRDGQRDRDDKHRQKQDDRSSSPASSDSANKADPWANARNRSKK